MKYSNDKHIERDPTMIIYCNGWCDYLRELVNLLQEKQWSFTFIDLRFDTKKAKELVSKLGNPLILPILDIKGSYYEKPPFSEVSEMLDLIRWRQHVDQTYYNKKPSGTY